MTDSMGRYRSFWPVLAHQERNSETGTNAIYGGQNDRCRLATCSFTTENPGGAA
jgi:hypothetical protein